MKPEVEWKKRAWYFNLLVLCLFFLIGTGIYWNSLDNPFQYDDQNIVQDNGNIRTLKNLPLFFIKSGMIGANPYEAVHYRPVVVSSYAINYAMGGLNTAGYHIGNLAFHAGSAFLVFLILQAMLGGAGSGGILTPLAAGLIFLVHPFNSEAVNYITARFSVMSGFFYLLGFYCWVMFRNIPPFSTVNKVGERGIYYAASLLVFILGMLSKEIVITLPIVLWLYDLYFKKNRYSEPDARHSALRILFNWRTYIPYLPFVIIFVIPYVVMWFYSPGGVLPHFKRDIFSQILTSLPVLILHWKLFLIPLHLTPVHHVEILRTFWSFPVISSAILLTVYTIIAILLLRSSSRLLKNISFFMLWFFIVLLPTTIIPLNAIFQENRGYLACVSFVVLAGIAIGELDKKMRGKTGVVLLVFLIVIYSALVIQRNRVWKDDLTLWRDTVQKEPQSPLGYTALGVAYHWRGMYNDAFDAFQKALILGGEDNFIVHDAMARIYMTRKNWDMAAQEFEKALRAFYFKAETHHDLAVAYFRMDRLDLSEKHFREAARLNPGYYKAYYNMGVLYTKEGRLEEAVHAYKQAISLSAGDLYSRFNLGMLLEESGKKEEAAEQYRIVAENAHGDEGDLSSEAGIRLERLKQYNIKARRRENGRQESGN
ncbi:MAG: tetratricopeptide repeat protein [Nitrospirae bacterium]|nr:tetratricopeptide repeat protein [Nitrospirota bacterium]